MKEAVIRFSRVGLDALEALWRRALEGTAKPGRAVRNNAPFDATLGVREFWSGRMRPALERGDLGKIIFIIVKQ